mgnify:CR=1 FL=1
MTDKKSFVLYFDNKTQFDMLSDDQAGKLIKGIYEFVCSGVTPEFEDGMIRMAFSFISAAIVRDTAKYEEKCRKNKENVKKRFERQRSLTNEYERKRSLSNVTDNDIDIVNENDNDNEKGNDNENDMQSSLYDCENSPSPSEGSEKIIEHYHKICSNFSRITAITPERCNAVNSLLSKYSEEKVIEMFNKASRSAFLNGSNSRNWRANFDWLINEANFLKILEGNYDNAKNSHNSIVSDGFYPDKYASLVNNFD